MLNAIHERIGVVDMVAVDPDYQGRGIARQLMDRAHANAGGGISRPWAPAVTGHGPARASYEALGYTALTGARYLRLLDWRA